MQTRLFSNKTAIVTGAGQGIGFEICRQFAESGGYVILNDSDERLAAAAADRINRQSPGSCVPISGDCSETNIIHTMVEEAVSQTGHLDVAIANAGITLFGDFLTYTRESFNKVLQVNMGGSFFLAQAAANRMKLQGSGGSILLMSSVTGHQAHKNLAAYGMTKAALEMLARNLVAELAPLGINVNAIAPGATLTERTVEDEEYNRTWSAITPMGKPATVAEIAHAALFLVSDQARHITGQSLIIDGGWTSMSPSPY